MHEQTSPGFPSKQLSVNSDDVPRRHPLHHDLCNDWLLQRRDHEKHRQWAAMVCCPSAIASTRVTALASLQGLNVRAFNRATEVSDTHAQVSSRQSSAISSPLPSSGACGATSVLPDARSILPLSWTASTPAHRRSRTLPRHADVCLVSTEFAMTSLQVFGNGRVAA